MEAFSPPQPAIDLASDLYCQTVWTLTDRLPPRDESPEALHARNHAAIAKVAALRPVNAMRPISPAPSRAPSPRKCDKFS